ncbi:MAG: hypothetical protein QXE84_03730 [Candidatus Nitrosotenuis sp.]|uniref:Putative flagella assembly protein FlaF n=1 Tax=Candidatus Nitrosotenuis uzonensis TaxID=1407055 RepID=A0A812F2I1_9ARCH|nr:hypothetical protein [Candidatus Nitrosotenuis uzonensis]CAE6491815.1 putative flagella assembly protein FlaF [Candidatus Nitrosotenuis uzonensis]
MGLSVAIAGGIVMFSMIYVMLTLPNMIDQTISINKASSEIAEIENSILKTNMAMSSFTVTDAANGYVQFEIENLGTEKMWNFTNFDVLVTYQINSSPWNRTESLTYSEECNPLPASGNWCRQSISNDNIDPKILNNGETLTARGRVSQTIDSGLATAVVSSNNGVVTARTYSVP